MNRRCAAPGLGDHRPWPVLEQQRVQALGQVLAVELDPVVGDHLDVGGELVQCRAAAAGRTPGSSSSPASRAASIALSRPAAYLSAFLPVAAGRAGPAGRSPGRNRRAAGGAGRAWPGARAKSSSFFTVNVARTNAGMRPNHAAALRSASRGRAAIRQAGDVEEEPAVGAGALVAADHGGQQLHDLQVVQRQVEGEEDLQVLDEHRARDEVAGGLAAGARRRRAGPPPPGTAADRTGGRGR